MLRASLPGHGSLFLIDLFNSIPKVAVRAALFSDGERSLVLLDYSCPPQGIPRPPSPGTSPSTSVLTPLPDSCCLAWSCSVFSTKDSLLLMTIQLTSLCLLECSVTLQCLLTSLSEESAQCNTLYHFFATWTSWPQPAV